MDAQIALLAKYSFLLILLFNVFAFVLMKRTIKKQIFILSLVSLPISFIISRIANKIIINPRPFVVEHIQPLIPHIADNGFPSDHTLLIATISAVVFVYNKKWGAVLLILSILSGYTRVLARVHHLEDILGSIVIAGVATIIALKVVKLLTKYHLPEVQE